MTQVLDDATADPWQIIADLRLKLDARTAELAERDSQYGERIEQQSATVDVLKVMSASPGDPQPVFDLITRRARELCNANAAALWSFDGELIHFLSNYAPGGTAEGDAAYRRQFPMAPTRGGSFGRAILDRQIVHIRDVDADPEVAQFVRDLGMRSVVAIPLLRDGTVIGAISINAKEPGGLSDGQVALLETFAEQAVIAITSAETYRELQQRTGDLQESLEYQTATAEVLQVINSSPGDLRPVFEVILAAATRLCEFNFSALWTYDGEAFRAVALHGVPQAFAEYLSGKAFSPPSGGRAGFAQLVAGRDCLHFEDVAAEESYQLTPQARAIVELAGARTSMLVALRKEGILLGAITAYRQEVRPFSDKQIALLQNFAAQAVIAMENARLITETREALEQQTATAEVLQVINSSPGNLGPVFEAMLDKALRLCGANFGLMNTYDGEHFHHAADHGVPAAYAKFRRDRTPPGWSQVRA